MFATQTSCVAHQRCSATKVQVSTTLDNEGNRLERQASIPRKLFLVVRGTGSCSSVHILHNWARLKMFCRKELLSAGHSKMLLLWWWIVDELDSSSTYWWTMNRMSFMKNYSQKQSGFLHFIKTAQTSCFFLAKLNIKKWFLVLSVNFNYIFCVKYATRFYVITAWVVLQDPGQVSCHLAKAENGTTGAAKPCCVHNFIRKLRPLSHHEKTHTYQRSSYFFGRRNSTAGGRRTYPTGSWPPVARWLLIIADFVA